MTTQQANPIVGTITVVKDYDVQHTGETASNYTITRIKAGKYPVQLKWSNGKRVLVAVLNASLMESYYVNRMLNASSVEHEKHNDGDKPTQHQWRWGDYNSTSAPPTGVCENIRLELNHPWIITADYRGNYASGGPVIFYAIDKAPEVEE